MLRRPNSFSEQRGFLTFIQNNNEVDYLNLAYCQALSIKCTQIDTKSYAVVVNKETKSLITDKHRDVFDYVIDLSENISNCESWRAWWLTPFKETIKLDADILFTSSVDNWWDGLQKNEVVLTSCIHDYEDPILYDHHYRRFFNDNLLPDIYSGIMYFRYGRLSRDFFIYARYIAEHWDQFKDKLLKNYKDYSPTSDVIFSLAAEMLGIENCTNKELSYPTFTHMPENDWGGILTPQLTDDYSFTIEHTAQEYPFHYCQNCFTDKLIEQYEGQYSQAKIS